MWIDPKTRRIHLSVGELARFRNQPASGACGHSRWRAQVGQRWHREAEAEARAAFPGAVFERNIRAEWLHEGWVFEIQGRIDQILPVENAYRLREVKTIRTPLPASVEELAERYPDYFTQAATYLCLCRKLPEWQTQQIGAELRFIEIESGMAQNIPLREEDERRFEAQLDRLLPYLEDRRNCRLRFEQSQIRPAFADLREGQKEAGEALASAALAAKTVLFEAPTGFGKTGTLLEHTLKMMQEGHFERCVYLTGKSTGQLETVRQLREMTGGSLRYLQMRNRREHKIESLRHRCTGDWRCDESSETPWADAAIHPAELFQDGHFPVDRARQLGEATGICPYALTRACLPYADFWIADYNYVFSPESRHVFLDAPGYDPAKTCLIVDEAHNLPERACSALSVQIHSHELTFATEELRTAGAPGRLIHLYRDLAREIDRAGQGESLNSQSHYSILDLAEEINRDLNRARFDTTQTPPMVLDVIWAVPRLLQALQDDSGDWLFWIPAQGKLAASCLSAPSWISQCLQPFACAHLMSATLQPLDTFQESCGLELKTTRFVEAEAAWRNQAYDTAIDTRVDTRLKARNRYYETTARTIAMAVASSPGRPVAVFFSSYQYAANVREYLGALDPMTRSCLQPRSGDLSEQANFIAEGLLTADALFLILGSSYAEGIDQLGGKIGTAIVVGPALPEMNLIQKTKLQNVSTTRSELAFEKVCIEPAMRRIHQALGRLIRSPGQHTRVLLHGRRFSEPAYFNQLRPEYQSDQRIHRLDALESWLFRS
ncbi:MAG: ATP-dependent DNA helicase [Opitutales bacterium]